MESSASAFTTVTIAAASVTKQLLLVLPKSSVSGAPLVSKFSLRGILFSCAATLPEGGVAIVSLILGDTSLPAPTAAFRTWSFAAGEEISVAEDWPTITLSPTAIVVIQLVGTFARSGPFAVTLGIGASPDAAAISQSIVGSATDTTAFQLALVP